MYSNNEGRGEANKVIDYSCQVPFVSQIQSLFFFSAKEATKVQREKQQSLGWERERKDSEKEERQSFKAKGQLNRDLQIT